MPTFVNETQRYANHIRRLGYHFYARMIDAAESSVSVHTVFCWCYDNK
jgi:hypothetical protein